MVAAKSRLNKEKIKSSKLKKNKDACHSWILMHDLPAHVIDYQNVSMVNFVRGQKVVPAGWLLSADGPEISLICTCLLTPAATSGMLLSAAG